MRTLLNVQVALVLGVVLSLVPETTNGESSCQFHPDAMEAVLYGVAYYPEYMPYERLDKDIKLLDGLKSAGLRGPGRNLHYYLNHSSNSQSYAYPCHAGTDLLTHTNGVPAEDVTLKPLGPRNRARKVMLVSRNSRPASQTRLILVRITEQC